MALVSIAVLDFETSFMTKLPRPYGLHLRKKKEGGKKAGMTVYILVTLGHFQSLPINFATS